MSEKEVLSARVDDSLKGHVDAYKHKRGYDNRGEAVNELLEIGLRESTNPLVYRLKDHVIEWVSWLGIAAIIVLVAGGTTSVLTVVDAAKLSVSLLGAATVLLGVYELTRVALGMNEIGSVIRGILDGEA